MKNVVTQNAEGSAVIAVNRGHRWGQNSVRFYWDRLKEEPYDCQATVYRGLPLFLKPCSFSPGNEHESTAEHARLVGGNLVVHQYPIFPPPPNWDMHSIDNKYPVFDEEDIFTGEKYQWHVYERGEQLESDARGKDIIVITSPQHICPPAFADQFSVLRLERELAGRELEKPHIKYVHIGRNSAGLPRKKREPLSGREYYRLEGSSSGASQEHPHEKVISMPFLPETMAETYRKVKRACTERKRLYQRLLESGELIIEDGDRFSLIADPAPKYAGQLVVVAKETQNILEADDDALRELGFMMRLGEQILNVLYDGPPLNTFFRQVFGKYKADFPEYLMSVRLVPRDPVMNGVHATIEEGLNLYVITARPEEVKSMALEVRKEARESLRASTSPVSSCP